MGPLSIVVTISMIKDFFEDYSRRKSDEEENTRKVYIIRPNEIAREVNWKELRIGDLIKIKKDD